MWDLSGLQADSLWDEVYCDPATGVAAAAFPDAQVMFHPLDAAQGLEDYLSVSATQVTSLGTYGTDPLQVGTPWTARNAIPVTYAWAPTNFFDIHAAVGFSSYSFPASEMPPGTPDLFLYDSVRVRTNYNVSEVVDAYGTLITPSGSYDVLRVKRTNFNVRSVDLRGPTPGGPVWLDASYFGQWDWLGQFATDTVYTVRFINDQTKETIALCTLDDAENEVTQVRYKFVQDISTATGDVAVAPSAVRVFPNPASDRIRLVVPTTFVGSCAVHLVDGTGREVLRQRTNVGGAGLAWDADVSGLSDGLYNGIITDPRGGRSVFRFVKGH